MLAYMLQHRHPSRLQGFQYFRILQEVRDYPFFRLDMTRVATPRMKKPEKLNNKNTKYSAKTKRQNATM